MKKLIFISMILLLLTACSTSPRNSYYTLTALAPPPSQQASHSLPSLAITSITLPELVDRPHLVIAGSGNNVTILEYHRWAESLKSSVPRIMADNLARLLGSDRVAAYPQIAAVNSDQQVTVDFQNFSATEEAVSVDALWMIKGAGKTSHTGRTRSVQKITGNYDSVAEAYSRALAVVCADIAGAITAGKP